MVQHSAETASDTAKEQDTAQRMLARLQTQCEESERNLAKAKFHADRCLALAKQVSVRLGRMNPGPTTGRIPSRYNFG